MKDIQGKLTLVQVSARFELVRIWVIRSQLYYVCFFTYGIFSMYWQMHGCKWHTVSLPYTLGSLTEDWRYCTRVWTTLQLMLGNITPPYPTEYKPVHNKVWLLPLFLTPYPTEFKQLSIPSLSNRMVPLYPAFIRGWFSSNSLLLVANGRIHQNN